MSIQNLTNILQHTCPARISFALIRYGERVAYIWDAYGGGALFSDDSGNELVRGRDFLNAFDQFVEQVEEGARPPMDAEPPPSFEVWRFDRASAKATPYSADEMDGCSIDWEDALDAAQLSALTSAFVDALDETFNAPSLYDARDLRAKTL